MSDTSMLVFARLIDTFNKFSRNMNSGCFVFKNFDLFESYHINIRDFVLSDYFLQHFFYRTFFLVLLN